MAYTAGAERLDRLSVGTQDRFVGDSQENILPKIPHNVVLVRKDIVSPYSSAFVILPADTSPKYMTSEAA